MAGDRKTVVIDHLGAQGDGVVVDDADGALTYVKGALAGETVVVSAMDHADRARLEDVVTPSAARTEAICPHFGVCGGCVMQHLERSASLDWKTETVRVAFATRGLQPKIAPIVVTDVGMRRRATFVAKRTASGDVFGFHEALSHTIVDITVCPILVPDIVAAFAALKALASAFLDLRPGADLRMAVTAANNGLDIALDAADVEELSAIEQRDFTRFAAAAPAVRVSYAGEALALRAAPVVTFGPAILAAKVVVPPGAFLQAVASAEQRMADLILKALPKRTKTIADLFCGLGAFTFPLASRARVMAVDSDKAVMAALAAGAKQAKGIKPVTALTRDLFQMPLSRTELNAFDAVVFDPPRAGAKAQVEALARSKVPVVVAVSCNPATLARDARTLTDGGYHLRRLTPIDQFLFSPHVECVAVFER